ncbi:BamA/TamA family outer membrane protein [Flavobacterium ardleyense]|uniref:BamA/TamA family outer membrane protein n=1 Tax=Flavobacterium ardleyense TaxID=2038737 RepID=UPI00298D1118|nr:BamA/TamA family outer membrane protein [Flavobacterium ardleyense]
MTFTSFLKINIIAVVLLVVSQNAFSQEENIEIAKDSVPFVTLYDLFKKKENRVDTPQALTSFIILPTLGYQPANGFTGGFISQYSFREKEEDRVSLLSGGASYSTKKQILTYAKNNMYLKGDTYFLSGDLRYYVFSQSNFGLGSDIVPYGEAFENFNYEAIEEPMKYNYFKFHQTANYKILPNIYAGLGIHIDSYDQIQDELLNLEANQLTEHYNYSQEYGYNDEHYTVAGGSANLIYDGRDNLINTNSGLFVNLSYRFNPEIRSSQQQSSTLTLDSRYFIPLSKSNKQHVLGFWLYGQFLTSGNLPYLNLPAIGWDQNSRTGKGYIQGLFRGANLAFLETEYRFPILKNQLISGTVFVNATSASDVAGDLALFHTIQPAVGLGLRVLLDKNTLTNFVMNFGLGRDSTTFYFNDGEGF